MRMEDPEMLSGKEAHFAIMKWEKERLEAGRRLDQIYARIRSDPDAVAAEIGVTKKALLYEYTEVNEDREEILCVRVDANQKLASLCENEDAEEILSVKKKGISTARRVKK